MKTYILLNSIQPTDFDLNTITEVQEAAEEFGCFVFKSQNQHFFASNNRDALMNMVDSTDLEGSIVEVTEIWDNFIKE